MKKQKLLNSCWWMYILLLSLLFSSTLTFIDKMNLQQENLQIKDNYADLWCKEQIYEFQNISEKKITEVNNCMINIAKFLPSEETSEINKFCYERYSTIITETRSFETGRWLEKEKMIECLAEPEIFCTFKDKTGKIIVSDNNCLESEILELYDTLLKYQKSQKFPYG